jgi:hypothetical protein
MVCFRMYLKVGDFTFEVELSQTSFHLFSLKKFLSPNFSLHAWGQFIRVLHQVTGVAYIYLFYCLSIGKTLLTLTRLK